MSANPVTASDDWRTLRLNSSMHSEPRVSQAFEEQLADDAANREAAAKATADTHRDALFARRAAKLALEAKKLDTAMRAAGVNRDVYRQVAHASRALQVALRMLREFD